MEPSSELQSYIDQLEQLDEQLSTSDAVGSWLTPFRQSAFKECIQELDSLLATESNNLLARLVWIRSHLALRQLPLTALCSPLEEIPLDELSKNAQSCVKKTDGSNGVNVECIQAKFAKALYLQTAIQLTANGQGRLAWSMTEKALSISFPQNTFGEYAVCEFAEQLVTQEIQRAEQKRESVQYKEALQQAKTEVLAKKAALSPSLHTTPKEEEHRPHSASSQSSLTAKDIAERAPSVAHSTPITNNEHPATHSSLLRFALFCSALLVASAGGFFLWQDTQTQSHAHPAPIPLAIAEPATLLPPKFEISANRPLDKKLESVGKRLETLGLDSTSAGGSKSNVREDEIDIAALSPEHAKSLSSPVSEANDELVSIDGTSGHEETIPRYDPAQVSSKITGEVEALGESGNKIPIPSAALGSSLKVDPEGRVFGPAQQKDPAPHGGRATALDGSPLRSYEVEKFSPPQLFRTITATRVLSAPSILSSTLAELPENTPIHVSARMGRWLELRSTGGRVGYIFSQDASLSK